MLRVMNDEKTSSTLTLARGQNIDRAAKDLKHLQDFSNLSRWLACFKVHIEPNADAGDACKLVLPQVLLLTCASDQGADIGGRSDLLCHCGFPDRENIETMGPLSSANFPVGKFT